MKLHERFGLSEVQVDADDRAKIVSRTDAHLDRIDLMPGKHQSLPHRACMTAVAYYLMEDHGAARKFAERVVPAALDYYFGDWRTKVKSGSHHELPPDPAWWHNRESWMDVFVAALCWGSVLGEWKEMRKLATYPDDRRSMEESGIDKKPALRQLLLEFAKFLRGERIAGVAARVGELVGAEWRGTRVLAESLDAVAAKDQRTANDTINRYLNLRHKRKRSKDITDTISMEGTFMVNLARHEGLHIEVDPKFEMYLIEL